MAKLGMAGAGLAVCSWLAAPAHANWAYTQWGMTPEQVAAASSGAVQVLAPAARSADPMGSVLAASGTYKDGPLRMNAGFTFDQKGGLDCVMYNATGDDVAVLRNALGSRYGKPFKARSSATDEDIIWHTPDVIEFASLPKPLVAAVTHCKPDRP